MSKRSRPPTPSPTPSPSASAKSPDPIALHAPGAVFPDGYGTLAAALRNALVDRSLLSSEAHTTLALGDPIRWPRERSRRVIGLMLPESDELYPAAIAALHGPDVLLAPSVWAAQAVQSATLRDVDVVPLGVDAKRFAYRRRERGATLRFLHLSPRGDDPRKGADLAIAAFERAFPKRDDVSLVVRSAQPMTPPPRRDARISFAGGALHADRVAELLYGFDALISTSRAEAFGLLPLEALATGLPTVFTGASGSADYADLGSPVGAREVCAPRPRLGRWFEPQVDEIVDRLREIDADYDGVAERTAADARTISERYNWARTLDAIRARV